MLFWLIDFYKLKPYNAAIHGFIEGFTPLLPSPELNKTCPSSTSFIKVFVIFPEKLIMTEQYTMFLCVTQIIKYLPESREDKMSYWNQ